MEEEGIQEEIEAIKEKARTRREIELGKRGKVECDSRKNDTKTN